MSIDGLDGSAVAAGKQVMLNALLAEVPAGGLISVDQTTTATVVGSAAHLSLIVTVVLQV